MMDFYYNTKRALSQIALFGERDGTHSRNSIGLRAHSLHGAELNQSLEQSRLACCRYIITHINKKRTRPRRVTGTFLDILYHKKPLLRAYLSIMDAGGLM